MKFPEKVLQKVSLVLRQNEKRKQEAEERVSAAKRERDDLEKARKSRKTELLGYAKEVSAWLAGFYGSEDVGKLFSALVRSDLTIFCDNFWQGFPKPKHSYCYASISVDKSKAVLYRERYKGMPAHESGLGKVPLDPRVLVSKLHPEYLKNLAEHLRSGKVWDYIDNEVSAHVRIG